MRSLAVIAAAAAFFATAPLAGAQDGSPDKSAPVKGPPNANGAETSDQTASPKMKGPPNATGYDDAKEKPAGPK